MLLIFLIDISKFFLKATFYQNNWLFFESPLYGSLQITLFGLEIEILNQLVDTKMQIMWLKKNEVFNQLVECSNRKLTCIYYHLKGHFHTVQENIHWFIDRNDLFSPMVILPNRSIELAVAVYFPSSHSKLWQNGDKVVKNGDKMLSCDKMVTKWCHWNWAINRWF